MEFDKAVSELETLVRTLEQQGDERALLLLELVDAIHRPALARLVAGDHEHPIARAVLAMYDLAEVDERTRVEEALDEVRPYVHSHGGEVELLDVSEGIVRIRMSGSCHGCVASGMTLERGIEAALRERYPGFREVVAEQAPQAAAGDGAKGAQLLQIENVPGTRPQRPVFVEAAALEELPPGELAIVEVDGTKVLLANVGGELYAHKDGCALDGSSLAGGRLAGPVIVCPWHNCAYDARSGARADDSSQPPLTSVPIAIREGRVEVAVNVA